MAKITQKTPKWMFPWEKTFLFFLVTPPCLISSRNVSMRGHSRKGNFALLKYQYFRFRRNAGAQVEILNWLEEQIIEHKAFDASRFKSAEWWCGFFFSCATFAGTVCNRQKSRLLSNQYSGIFQNCPQRHLYSLQCGLKINGRFHFSSSILHNFLGLVIYAFLFSKPLFQHISNMSRSLEILLYMNSK